MARSVKVGRMVGIKCSKKKKRGESKEGLVPDQEGFFNFSLRNQVYFKGL